MDGGKEEWDGEMVSGRDSGKERSEGEYDGGREVWREEARDGWGDRGKGGGGTEGGRDRGGVPVR